WAYRYRLEGRNSERPQVGGFATRAEAEKALRRVLDRLVRTQALAARTAQGRNRPGPWPLRPTPHLRHLRPPCRRARVRGLTLHGHEHRHDRPPLRTPRHGQPRTRRRPPRRARLRANRGRCVTSTRTPLKPLRKTVAADRGSNLTAVRRLAECRNDDQALGLDSRRGYGRGEKQASPLKLSLAVLCPIVRSFVGSGAPLGIKWGYKTGTESCLPALVYLFKAG